MIPRDRGHIVNISSQAGKFGAPGGATYSATKHAVVGLTEAVRGELRLMGAHIDLSYVMPYVVNTELGSGLGEARGLTQPRARPTSPTRSSRRCSCGTVDVWVPKSAKRTNVLGAVLPRALVGGHGARDEGRPRARRRRPITRRAYELRAARSEPGLEAGDRAGSDPQLRRRPAAGGDGA